MYLQFSPSFLRPTTPPSVAGGSASPSSNGAVDPSFYNERHDGNIVDFIHSDKGKRLLTAFREEINQLKQFMVDHGDARDHTDDVAQTLELFFDRLKEGTTGYFSTQLSVIYGSGKKELSELCAALKGARAPWDQWVRIVKNLQRA